MEALHMAMPVRSGLDEYTAYTQRVRMFRIVHEVHSFIYDTHTNSTSTNMQLDCVGVYTTNTQTSTRSETRSNITPRTIAPAARRGGALRPPVERLLCMIVLRCDRSGAKT